MRRTVRRPDAGRVRDVPAVVADRRVPDGFPAATGVSTFTRRVTAATRSRRKASANAPPPAMSDAAEAKATWRPSAPSDGDELTPLASPPAASTLTRSVLGA
jgi:hypothetical protein